MCSWEEERTPSPCMRLIPQPFPLTFQSVPFCPFENRAWLYNTSETPHISFKPAVKLNASKFNFGLNVRLKIQWLHRGNKNRWKLNFLIPKKKNHLYALCLMPPLMRLCMLKLPERRTDRARRAIVYRCACQVQPWHTGNANQMSSLVSKAIHAASAPTADSLRLPVWVSCETITDCWLILWFAFIRGSSWLEGRTSAVSCAHNLRWSKRIKMWWRSRDGMLRSKLIRTRQLLFLARQPGRWELAWDTPTPAVSLLALLAAQF